MALAVDYYEQVMSDGDLEDKRKAIELAARITGAEAEKKVNPLAGLPVFNIVIHSGHGGGVTAALQSAEVVDMETDTELDTELELGPKLTPTPAMLSMLGINADIAAEVAQ